ncbi:hypothetical protein Cus16_1016 [Curtobacterium sp. ER1/6]|nr:hypothetical protein Cus16_1016 [Curtobacterium sp. ER1/6]
MKSRVGGSGHERGSIRFLVPRAGLDGAAVASPRAGQLADRRVAKPPP